MSDREPTGHIPEHRLFEYLDEALTPAQIAGLERHLEDCPACQTELRKVHEFFTSFAGLPDEPLLVDLAPGVVRTIRTQENIWLSGRWLAAIQITTALLVLVFSWPLLLPETQDNPVWFLSTVSEQALAGALEAFSRNWTAWSAAANDLLGEAHRLVQTPVTSMLPGVNIWPWAAALGVFWLAIHGFLLRPAPEDR